MSLCGRSAARKTGRRNDIVSSTCRKLLLTGVLRVPVCQKRKYERRLNKFHLWMLVSTINRLSIREICNSELDKLHDIASLIILFGLGESLPLRIISILRSMRIAKTCFSAYCKACAGFLAARLSYIQLSRNAAGSFFDGSSSCTR